MKGSIKQKLTWSRKIAVLLIVTSLLLPGLLSWPVNAVISSCSASVTPVNITPQTTANFQFNITNTSSSTVTWMRISRPSSNYYIAGDPDLAGWSYFRSGEQLTLIEGNLSAGASLLVTVPITTEAVQSGPENWVVQMSDDPDGVAATACSGSLSTSISGNAPDTQEPEISNISLSSLTATSVIISWQTDEPAVSRVDYGTTNQYGQSKNSNSLLTSHQITLTGLKPDTGYHFRAASTNPAGNEGLSGDNTFLTPLLGSSSASSPLITPIPIKAIPTEKVPPSINLTTPFANPYRDSPQIAGSASDNEALAGIYYSTDGGKNWQLVETTTGLGTKKAVFTIQPQNLDDGNYEVMARAIDTSGNETTTV